MTLLFQEFLSRAASRFGREAPAITPAVRDHLRRHDWPGGVRLAAGPAPARAVTA